MAICISDNEFAIHRTLKALRFLKKALYPNSASSGEAIKEFVALADECRQLGVTVISQRALPQALKNHTPIMKFGRADIHADINLLSQYPNRLSEWNANNLEKTFYWSQYVQVDRKLWNFHLDIAEHKEALAALFPQHGALFIKTVTKGWAGIYSDFANLMDSLGNLSLLCEASKDIIVSELMDIQTISVTVAGKVQNLPDEWRHYVYRGKRVASCHAFVCDANGTDHRSREQHCTKADNIIQQLAGTDFASSYVLDTCMLRSGRVDVVEINNFFASGIYDNSAVKAIAGAIAADGQ